MLRGCRLSDRKEEALDQTADGQLTRDNAMVCPHCGERIGGEETGVRALIIICPNCARTLTHPDYKG